MSNNDNIINKVIRDNFKITDDGNGTAKEEINSIGNDNDNDKSFNRLQNLQLLVQKHSGLKELCKLILSKYY